MLWIPRLSAEESLLAATRVAVGTGSLEKGTGPDIVRQWQAIARPQDVPASVHTERRKAAIAAAGIKVFRPKQTT